MTTEWQRFQAGLAVECQCLDFSALQRLLQPPVRQAMKERNAVQEQFGIKQSPDERVAGLLKAALANGTLEKALSTPVKLVPLPLPSCPTLSAKSIKNQIKELLDDGLAVGALRLDQAEHLRNLVSTYNALSDASHYLQQQASNKAPLTQPWATENGHISSEHLIEASDIFPDLHQTLEFASDALGTEVGKLLEEALNNGTIEKALSTPAAPVPLPLPSCPSLSAASLTTQIKKVLEDGLADGALNLLQVMNIRDLLSTHKELLSRQKAEANAVKVIDYSKPRARLDNEKISLEALRVKVKESIMKCNEDISLEAIRAKTKEALMKFEFQSKPFDVRPSVGTWHKPKEQVSPTKLKEQISPGKSKTAYRSNFIDLPIDQLQVPATPFAGFDKAYYQANFSLAGVQETLRRFPFEPCTSDSAATSATVVAKAPPAQNKKLPPPPAPLPPPPAEDKELEPSLKAYSKDLPTTGADLEIQQQEQEKEFDRLSQGMDATTEDTTSEWTGGGNKKKNRKWRSKGKGKGKGKNNY